MNSSSPAVPPAESPAGRSRPTPRQGDHPQPRPAHTPGALALSERRRAEAWKAIALVCCLASSLLTYLSIRAARTAEVVHVMDPMGNMYAGPVEPLADSKAFFNTTALYATNVALQRSAAGFDLFELLKLYFTPRAVSQLQDDHKKREAELRRRSVQWKPIIDVIGPAVPAGETRILEVRGRLVTAGAYANRSFYEEPPFRVVFTFIRNPDLGKAGAYPWVCNELEVTIEELPRKAR